MNSPLPQSQEDQTVYTSTETVQRKPTNVLLWIIASIALLSLAGNAYFFLVKPSQSVRENHVPVVGNVSPTETPTTPPTLPATMEISTTKEKLATVLAQECEGQSINFSVLPFTISPDLVTKYTKAGIRCEELTGLKTQRYLAFSNSKNDTVIESYMFVYHPQSIYNGYMDPLTDDVNAVSIMVKGRQYSLSILEPGPYGISEEAVIVQLSAKKADGISESTVKAFASSNFQDDQTMQLVRKYGSRPVDAPEDMPITVDNKAAFKQDFIKNIQTEGTVANEHLKSLTVLIDSDLDGISF